ncbi:hypothetical protein ALPO108162_14775 [Alicyclobacillus pomorum]
MYKHVDDINRFFNLADGIHRLVSKDRVLVWVDRNDFVPLGLLVFGDFVARSTWVVNEPHRCNQSSVGQKIRHGFVRHHRHSALPLYRCSMKSVVEGSMFETVGNYTWQLLRKQAQHTQLSV